MNNKIISREKADIVTGVIMTIGVIALLLWANVCAWSGLKSDTGNLVLVSPPPIADTKQWAEALAAMSASSSTLTVEDIIDVCDGAKDFCACAKAVLAADEADRAQALADERDEPDRYP